MNFFISQCKGVVYKLFIFRGRCSIESPLQELSSITSDVTEQTVQQFVLYGRHQGQGLNGEDNIRVTCIHKPDSLRYELIKSLR